MQQSLTILLATSFALASLSSTQSKASSRPELVDTIAGSGLLGNDDRVSNLATFLIPTGIAKSKDGTLYISDEAGQRIRALKDGRVTTAAGSGELGPLGMSVVGGYKDGPAATARFNHPIGLAVGSTDNILIADAANKAVRELSNGAVKTIISSGLSYPEGLAFDNQGNLWIADFGGGLKVWDGHTLRTTALPNLTKNCIAVSISPDHDDPKLVVSTAEAILEFDEQKALKSVQTPYQGAVSLIAPTEGWTFGSPREIVAIGDHQVLYSDPVTNTIRFLRFNVLPFAGQPYSGLIAGGSDYKGINNAGFADGLDARFYAPRGLIVDKDKIIVADAGNRRIRSLPLPNFRTQEYGFDEATPYDASRLQIALVGPSTAFFDSHDDEDSICGAIESQLHGHLLTKRGVSCHTHRIDAATSDQIWNYIDNYLVFRHIDYYVIQSRPDAVNQEFVDSVKKLLSSTKAHLLLVWYPRFSEVSDSEDIAMRDTTLMPFPDDVSAERAAQVDRATSMLKGIKNLSVYDAYPDLVTYEKGQNPPLFLSPNSHMNARGNVFVGDHVGGALLNIMETEKP